MMEDIEILDEEIETCLKEFYLEMIFFDKMYGNTNTSSIISVEESIE